MVVDLTVLLPPELAEALEQASRDKGIGKSTLVRMLLADYLKPWLSPSLQPQPQASPVPPRAKGLERAGDDRADEAQLISKEKTGGGEGG
jgi:hypothetical protein